MKIKSLKGERIYGYCRKTYILIMYKLNIT